MCIACLFVCCSAIDDYCPQSVNTSEGNFSCLARQLGDTCHHTCPSNFISSSPDVMCKAGTNVSGQWAPNTTDVRCIPDIPNEAPELGIVVLIVIIIMAVGGCGTMLFHTAYKKCRGGPVYSSSSGAVDSARLLDADHLGSQEPALGTNFSIPMRSITRLSAFSCCRYLVRMYLFLCFGCLGTFRSRAEVVTSAFQSLDL